MHSYVFLLSYFFRLVGHFFLKLLDKPVTGNATQARHILCDKTCSGWKTLSSFWPLYCFIRRNGWLAKTLPIVRSKVFDTNNFSFDSSFSLNFIPWKRRIANRGRERNTFNISFLVVVGAALGSIGTSDPARYCRHGNDYFWWVQYVSFGINRKRLVTFVLVHPLPEKAVNLRHTCCLRNEAFPQRSHHREK